MKFAASGAGTTASQSGPGSQASLFSVVGTSDDTVALDATVYISESAYTNPTAAAASLPSDAQPVLHIKQVAKTSQNYTIPQGVPIGQVAIIVSFADAGAGHEVYVFVK